MDKSTPLVLVPEEALDSITARVETLLKVRSYIKEVSKRYEGLKVFEDGLKSRGLLEIVNSIRNEDVS